MMASTASATAAAAVAFGAAAKPRGLSSASCARVAAGGRRRSGVVVRCDAGVEAQVQAVAKAASIAALEQFKISADRYIKERSSIAVIGLTVHTAPVEMREKLAVAEELWPRAIQSRTYKSKPY